MRPWEAKHVEVTLHRPTQASEVCTCCHAHVLRDTSGRVHVSVCPVPERNAHESRLALTTLRSDVLAGLQLCTAKSGPQSYFARSRGRPPLAPSRITSSTRNNPPKKDSCPTRGPGLHPRSPMSSSTWASVPTTLSPARPSPWSCRRRASPCTRWRDFWTSSLRLLALGIGLFVVPLLTPGRRRRDRGRRDDRSGGLDIRRLADLDGDPDPRSFGG